MVHSVYDWMKGWGFVKWLESIGIEAKVSLPVILSFLLSIVAAFLPEGVMSLFYGLLVLSPIWLPPVLWEVFSILWKKYVNAAYNFSQQTCLLEIKIPREIFKSPRAMEVVLGGFHIGSGETTFINRDIEGKTRPWFSLEMVSTGGRIHFYIWTRTFYKKVIESHIYAQYPEVEIFEVEDYTTGKFYVPGKTDLFGADLKLGADDALPIKTYVDYELDTDPKEEYKIDPLAHVLEFFSTLQEGEEAWFQILIQLDKETIKDDHGKVVNRWKSGAASLIKKIKQESIVEIKDAEGKSRQAPPNLSPRQKQQMEAIDRNLGKLPFRCGMRVIYFAQKDKFRGFAIPGLLGTTKQFSSDNLNGIQPTRWLTIFDFPWQDYNDMRKRARKHKVLEAYKWRHWFYPPYKTPTYVMTNEEIATLFHFPSSGVKAPGLDRIPAKKSEAPPNLPI